MSAAQASRVLVAASANSPAPTPIIARVVRACSLVTASTIRSGGHLRLVTQRFCIASKRAGPPWPQGGPKWRETQVTRDRVWVDRPSDVGDRAPRCRLACLRLFIDGACRQLQHRSPLPSSEVGDKHDRAV